MINDEPFSRVRSMAAALDDEIEHLRLIEQAAKRVDAQWYGDGTEQSLHDALTELHQLVSPRGHPGYGGAFPED